jgi:hypothetical protein
MNPLRLLFPIFLSIASCNYSFGQTLTGKDTALETLGGVTALMLYNTYVCIGAIADGYGAEVYDDLTVEELMDEQIVSLTSVEQQLNTLLQSDFLTDADDRAFLTDAIATVKLLRDEADALADYAINLEEEAMTTYDTARTAAWKKIAALLGIEE